MWKPYNQLLKAIVLIPNHPKYTNQVAMLYCTPVT